MKCPECGKWNQATMPHCVYCGAELPNDAYGAQGVPAWQLELQDDKPPNSYFRVDDAAKGEAEATIDPREILAREMVALKSRKLTGEQQQRRLRTEAARRGVAPSGRSVRTTSNRGTFFSVEDNPVSTLRPVPPELIESGDVEPDAKRVYPARYRTTYSRSEDGSVYDYGTTRRIENISKPDDIETIYDGYHDTSAYLPAHANQDEIENSMLRHTGMQRKPHRRSARRFLNISLAVLCLALSAWLVVAVVLPMVRDGKKDNLPSVTVTPTIREDLAAHTVTIPGIDGQRITIRELRTSAIVTGGVATFDILDHIWYDDYDDYLSDTMTVRLTPFVISESGKQNALEPIEYDIDIPLSPIELDTPDSPYQVVSTAMFNIIFYVREGSTVHINGEDYSDLVNTEGGKVNYNATVQPIGENEYTIVVRSQYCRENSTTITLYREKQDIPLDLASDIASRSSDGSATMTVRATTVPGAIVKVLSPYTDLDITNTAIDGSFSFKAVFDRIGNNTIIITADYPGKQTTRVEHVVYYVPNIDIYSKKAWSVLRDYNDLMDNIDLRKRQSQIYECKGVITSIETTKPQRAFMNVGTEESPLLIYVENSSRTEWEVGQSYRLYADAFGMYSSKPWLVVRYTYGIDEK